MKKNRFPPGVLSKSPRGKKRYLKKPRYCEYCGEAITIGIEADIRGFKKTIVTWLYCSDSCVVQDLILFEDLELDKLRR